MKPYEDENCECHRIQKEIDEQYPRANWNMDNACKSWHDQKEKLEDNNIEFEPHSDNDYGCTCPTCGRMLCGWCI